MSQKQLHKELAKHGCVATDFSEGDVEVWRAPNGEVFTLPLPWQDIDDTGMPIVDAAAPKKYCPLAVQAMLDHIFKRASSIAFIGENDERQYNVIPYHSRTK